MLTIIIKFQHYSRSLLAVLGLSWGMCGSVVVFAITEAQLLEHNRILAEQEEMARIVQEAADREYFAATGGGYSAPDRSMTAFTPYNMQRLKEDYQLQNEIAQEFQRVGIYR